MGREKKLGGTIKRMTFKRIHPFFYFYFLQILQ